ncbi:hypothetical protein [Thalassotalea marina]|uniref:Uncharacterized protein n=1 Tax=Thalassotalea marina TaxID=1673741 RepID=A0A919BT95_9GAMM|nr:hypothetical protein [Thalassotalea marina]GHG08182.1 hypothetical protein GCM10017161_42440 [Thalassotalea marina]
MKLLNEKEKVVVSGGVERILGNKYLGMFGNAIFLFQVAYGFAAELEGIKE